MFLNTFYYFQLLDLKEGKFYSSTLTVDFQFFYKLTDPHIITSFYAELSFSLDISKTYYDISTVI